MIVADRQAAPTSTPPVAGSERVNVHLYTAAVAHDSRFRKQAQSILRAGLAEKVVLLGQSYEAEPLDESVGKGIRLLRFRGRLARLPRFKLFGCLKYAEFTCREVLMARRMRPSSIQCHSVGSLPAAVLTRAVTRAPLVYDARELETHANGLRGVNRAFTRRLERSLIGHCDSVVCVSDSIADWYKREYGIPRPFVVRNIPDVRMQLSADHGSSLHEHFRIPREAVIFLYSGGLTAGRSIERVLRVFQQVQPDRHLVVMGFGPLEPLVRQAAAARENIHFLPAVPPDQVVRYVAGADVGFAAHLEPTCLNHRYALPNKFFEYLLAGVPVWVNDVHEEMAALVRRYDFGWVTPYGEEAMRAWVVAVEPGELRAKRALAASAQKHFSWETEEGNLIAAYRRAQQEHC